MSRGVPAGATMPNQVSASKPGSAVSATVGMSGADGERLALVTASARSEPALIWPMTAERLENMIGICPAKRSLIAPASPR